VSDVIQRNHSYSHSDLAGGTTPLDPLSLSRDPGPSKSERERKGAIVRYKAKGLISCFSHRREISRLVERTGGASGHTVYH